MDPAAAPETASETPAPSLPQAPAPAAPRRPIGGGNKARAQRRRLEKELRDLRARVEGGDPFAEDARGAVPASEGAAGDAPPPGDGTVPEGASETPPLGIEGARAMAPAYYGLINFASGFAIRRAPVFKGNPAEAKRVAARVRLDASGHYDAAGVLHTDSPDRMAIDPSLIPVLAKVRLTPEVVLVIVTMGVVLAKFAEATGDAEVVEMLSTLNPAPAA